MAQHNQDGEAAEHAARNFLLKQGLSCLESNYRSRHGEIDLIMQDSREIVFVEVRYRRSAAFGGAIDSITSAKQRKIRATAEYFLSSNAPGNYTGCRFDVIAVSGSTPRLTCEWIPDAF
ncbi:MAG: YraN family protein [Pseudomonadota bacterium]